MTARGWLTGWLVLAGTAFGLLWWTGHFWWGLAAFFPAHAAWLFAGLVPGCQWLGRVVTSFQCAPEEKSVWLTLDDGPSPGETERVLDLLRDHDAKATFFVVGEKAARHPDLLRRILAEGHSLGNHTQTHPEKWFWALPRFLVARELDACAQVLRAALGEAPRLFRSPVGMKPPGLPPLLKARRWDLIGWSVRGWDGVAGPLARVLERLQAGTRPGAILLMHEGRGHAPALLAELLPWLRQAGYACVIPDRTRWLPGDGTP